MGNGYKVLAQGVGLLLSNLDLHQEKRLIFRINDQV
jgi:hypothetical protein